MAGKPKKRRTPRKAPPRPGTRRPKPRRHTRVEPGVREAPSSASLWSDAVDSAGEVAELGDGRVRLNAWIARCGVASRRGADELIREGRVRVNDEITTSLGTRIDPLHDQVEVDGDAVRPEKPVYVVLHKPTGVVCTNARNEQKTRAIDLVERVKGRLFPVGRLDVDSEGLLILTNDGRFAERLMHPRYGVPKTYEVTIRGRIEQQSLEKARGGVWLAEGKTRGALIRVKRRGRERSFLEVMIREGKNREVRRIFARLGYPVLRLKRSRIGPLTIRGLGKGKFRFLTPTEVRALLESATTSSA